MAYAGTERRSPPPWYFDPRLLIALLTAGVTSGSTAIWWASDMKHVQIDHGRQIIETQARVATLESRVQAQLDEQNRLQNHLGQRLAIIETKSDALLVMLNNIDKRLEGMNQRVQR